MGTEWEIRQGDALERLREMPDESVQCCVTSPPYWGLRDYGVDGQLGLEATPEEYVANLVSVFAEVRRVLRDDGTLWLNLGDSYAGSWAGNSMRPEGGSQRKGGPGFQPLDGRVAKRNGVVPEGCKPKDLVGIPWMVAFALRADGWYLRRDVIWVKPNPTPESVRDRPTSAHEYLFLLSKSPRYFYDAAAIREPPVWEGQNGSSREPVESQVPGAPTHKGLRQDKQRGHGRRYDGFNDRWDSMSKAEQQALGRNKRSVWEIATRPYPEAHFATFPPALVEPCILAGTPPRTCGKCGAPWQRVIEKHATGKVRQRRTGGLGNEHRRETHGLGEIGGTFQEGVVYHTVGWRPTCDHDDDSGRAVVCDPFAGAATTGLVACRRSRRFIGIELNPEYVELGRNRIRDDAPLFNMPTETAA